MREPALVPGRRWLLASALGALALVHGCGTDEGRGVRSPGDAGAADGGADVTRATEAGSGLLPPEKRRLVGTHCRSNDDCAPPFTCVTSSTDVIATARGQGAPPHGLCTLRCDLDPGACDAAENPTECIELSAGRRFCLPSCEPGGASSLGEKCLGRLDLGCAPPQTPGRSGFCAPTCGGNFDCDDGRTCDLGSGACVDDSPRGAAIGADCTASECGNGTCETVGGFEVCTGFCTVGTVGCGFDPLSKDRLDSFCLLAATREGASSDIGLCAQLCDCNDDCRHPSFVCAEGPADSPTTLSVRGHRGACLPPSFAAPGGERGIPCGRPPRDAGADSRPEAGGTPTSVPGSDR